MQAEPPSRIGKACVKGDICTPSLVQSVAVSQQVDTTDTGGRHSGRWTSMTKAEGAGGKRLVCLGPGWMGCVRLGTWRTPSARAWALLAGLCLSCCGTQ